MTRALKSLVLIFGLAILIPAAHAQKKSFTATLSGAGMVPAVKTAATGHAIFHLAHNGKSIVYTLRVIGVEDPTMAHIHLAGAGKEGPVVAWLYPTAAYPVKTEMVRGMLSRGTITAAMLAGPMKGKTISDLLAEMRAGDTCVIIHTKAHPGGEIRGQIK